MIKLEKSKEYSSSIASLCGLIMVATVIGIIAACDKIYTIFEIGNRADEYE